MKNSVARPPRARSLFRLSVALLCVAPIALSAGSGAAKPPHHPGQTAPVEAGLQATPPGKLQTAAEAFIEVQSRSGRLAADLPRALIAGVSLSRAHLGRARAVYSGLTSHEGLTVAFGVKVDLELQWRGYSRRRSSAIGRQSKRGESRKSNGGGATRTAHGRSRGRYRCGLLRRVSRLPGHAIHPRPVGRLRRAASSPDQFFRPSTHTAGRAHPGDDRRHPVAGRGDDDAAVRADDAAGRGAASRPDVADVGR